MVSLFLRYNLVTHKLNMCISHVESLLSDSGIQNSKFHGLLFIMLERVSHFFTGKITRAFFSLMIFGLSVEGTQD